MPTYARLKNADSVEVDNIRSVAGAAFTAPEGLKTDTISEETAAAGVTIDGVLLKDSFVNLVTYGSAAWSDWTPTLGATGSMTYTSTSITVARYCKVGKLVFLSLRRIGNNRGTADTRITVTTPVAAHATIGEGMSCVIIDGGRTNGHLEFITASGFQIRRSDGANWSLGASRSIEAFGVYEAA